MGKALTLIQRNNKIHVEEIYNWMIGGVSHADVIKLAKKWSNPDGKALTTSQVNKLVAKANKKFIQVVEDNEVKEYKATARLLDLYKRALLEPDLKTALAILKEIHQVQGLTGKGTSIKNQKLVVNNMSNMSDEELDNELIKMKRVGMS